MSLFPDMINHSNWTGIVFSLASLLSRKTIQKDNFSRTIRCIKLDCKVGESPKARMEFIASL